MTEKEAELKAMDGAFREWQSSSIGGSANGAGLNSVALGDSGYGEVYGWI